MVSYLHAQTQLGGRITVAAALSVAPFASHSQLTAPTMPTSASIVIDKSMTLSSTQYQSNSSSLRLLGRIGPLDQINLCKQST